MIAQARCPAWRVYALLPVALLLSGCGVLKPDTGNDQPSLSLSAREALWNNHRQRIEQIKHWRAKGKIAVTSPQDSGSAQVNWWQVRSAFDIRLTGPLGAGTVRLKSDSTGAMLVSSNAERVRGATAGELLASSFGWQVPVESLSQWMLGLPGDAVEVSLDDQGRLSELTHQGWQVDFTAYTNIDPVTSLPRTLSLSKDAYKVKVAIADWEDKTPRVRDASLINTPAGKPPKDHIKPTPSGPLPTEVDDEAGPFKIPGIDL